MSSFCLFFTDEIQLIPTPFSVLYASWLFQHVVPPVIPFALGSLGFLTCFDFAKYSNVLNNAIDNGIRVNLRMRFTCTVYRAIEGEENKKRRAVRRCARLCNES